MGGSSALWPGGTCGRVREPAIGYLDTTSNVAYRLQKRTAGDSPQAAQRDLVDILALSGGVPIQVGNDTIGAVGSSGSNLATDDACAKASIAKVADLLK